MEYIKELIDLLYEKADETDEEPLFEHLVNKRGRISLEAIVAFLKKWTKENVDIDSAGVYLDALNKVEKGNDNYKTLLLSIMEKQGINKSGVNVLAISQFWSSYGYALAKCVGEYRKPASIDDYLSKYAKETYEQKTAAIDTINAYNDTDNTVNAIVKALFLPTLSGGKGSKKVIKRRIQQARRKAERLMCHQAIHETIVSARKPSFGGGVNKVPRKIAKHVIWNEFKKKTSEE